MSSCARNSIWFDHDGNLDDYVALLMLVNLHRRRRIHLLGVSVTPADCLREDGVMGTLSIMETFGVMVPVVATHEAGVNPFPMEWRKNAATVFKSSWESLGYPLVTEDSALGKKYDVAADMAPFGRVMDMMDSKTVTYVSVGPPTNLTKHLKKNPSHGGKLARVVCMGGAFDVKGNVEPDMLAEWNVYWDIGATRDLVDLAVDHSFDLRFVPLDLCEKFPVRDFAKVPFGSASCWPGIVQDMYVAIQQALPQWTYCLWDVCTVIAAVYPELFADQASYITVTDKGKTNHVDTAEPNAHIVRLKPDIKPHSVFRDILHTLESDVLPSSSSVRGKKK